MTTCQESVLLEFVEKYFKEGCLLFWVEIRVKIWFVWCFYCYNKVQLPNSLNNFFKVGTSSGAHLFDHLLWSLFYSSIFTHYNFFKFLQMLVDLCFKHLSFLTCGYSFKLYSLDCSCSVVLVESSYRLLLIINYLFLLKNSHPCRNLNPGLPSTKLKCYQLSFPGLDLSRQLLIHKSL